MLKRQLIQLSSAAILICVLACGPAAEPPQSVEEPSRPLSGGVEDEVGKFLDSYRLAIEARDASRLRTMYVDDGRFEWIEDGEIRYRSPDEVLAGLASLPSDVEFRTEYEGVEVARVGDTGARVAMRFRTVIGQGPSGYEFGGMISMVLEEGPTGWRIVGGHTSSARPDGR